MGNFIDKYLETSYIYCPICRDPLFIELEELVCNSCNWSSEECSLQDYLILTNEDEEE